MQPALNRFVWTAVAAVVVLGLIWAGLGLWGLISKVPTPLEDRCVATVSGRSTTIDLEQAHNVAIIAGVAITRGLPARATSIAFATAYQESDIRNLDYGHSDSLGIFQQRPSQGWGTQRQIMDPYYSSAKFFEALVKVKGWQTGDINDVAQKVQRSAYPEGYRRHVNNARTLASAAAGQTPASFSCQVSRPGAPDPDGLATFIRKALKGRAEVSKTDAGLSIVGGTTQDDWAIAHLAVGGVSSYGVSQVRVGDRVWTHDTSGLASWRTDSAGPADTVEVTFRKP